jgi:hypothetical protein
MPALVLVPSLAEARDPVACPTSVSSGTANASKLVTPRSSYPLILFLQLRLLFVDRV